MARKALKAENGRRGCIRSSAAACLPSIWCRSTCVTQISAARDYEADKRRIQESI
jgi:hypothetical protein